MSPHTPVLLYDGFCFLCTRSAQLRIRTDRQVKIKLAPLQSPKVAILLKENDFPKPSLDSLVLVHQNKLFLKTDALFEIAKIIGGGWKLLLVFKIVPLFIRDGIYDFIARNRYRWFGKSDSCQFGFIEEGRML